MIEAPSILGLKPSGVECLPEALKDSGIAQSLPVVTTSVVEPPPYSPRRGNSGVLNDKSLAAYSQELADAIGDAVARGLFALALGGDCSIMLGAVLALRRAGRYGLFFMDGHADFYQPAASPTGEAADMDLALATGRGPAALTNIEGRRPYIRDDDVVQFGQRDRQESIGAGSRQIQDTAIRVLDAETIARVGMREAVRQGLSVVARDQLRGFWVHLDADVIDDREMPAVDYRLPGGLSFTEVRATLARLIASGRVVGMSVTVFNPKLDPTGEIAQKLTQCLVDGLSDANEPREMHGANDTEMSFNDTDSWNGFDRITRRRITDT